jgi:hypothetical protein
MSPGCVPSPGAALTDGAPRHTLRLTGHKRSFAPCTACLGLRTGRPGGTTRVLPGATQRWDSLT